MTRTHRDGCGGVIAGQFDSLGPTPRPRVTTFVGSLLVEPKYGWAIANSSNLLRDSLTYGWETATWAGRSWIGLPPVGAARKQSDVDDVPIAHSALSPWPDNYYHFVVDVLPKFVLLDRCGMLDDDVPILVAESLYDAPFFHDAIGRGRLGTLSMRPLRRAVHVEKLTVAHASGIDCDLARDLREMLDVESITVDLSQNVFVTRSLRRGRVPVNIAEIEAFFVGAGFRVVDLDGMSFAEQVQLFRSAPVVAAIHGASLANLVWCDPASVVVIELVPRVHGDEFDFFKVLCDDLGIRYHRVLGDNEKYGHKRAPFTVPMSDLRRVVGLADAALPVAGIDGDRSEQHPVPEA